MNKIRHLGIYTLPDGGDRYVAYSFGNEGYYLYHLTLGVGSPPAYMITTDGQVIPQFRGRGKWIVADLKDTGETYNFRKGS